MTKEEKDKIVEENLWLIEYVARKYKNQADWSDMISAGRYGIVRGIEKYDPSKGKPSTYLIHWVRAEIMKCLYEDRNVHLPWNRINKYIKEREKAQFTDGIYPRFEVSLDSSYRKVENDDDESFQSSAIEFQSSLSSDFINTVEVEETKSHVLFALENSNLTEKERIVISHRYGLYNEIPKTLKEVGSIIGYTAMGVQKLEKKALAKLKNNSSLKMLIS